MSEAPRLGLSGYLTRFFIASPLTPLFLLASLALGLIALFALPREEEPQISVPMVDIFVSADGLKAEDAVKLVTEPLETIVKAINGVEHVYSNTVDDRVVVTARFYVGFPKGFGAPPAACAYRGTGPPPAACACGSLPRPAAGGATR